MIILLGLVNFPGNAQAEALLHEPSLISGRDSKMENQKELEYLISMRHLSRSVHSRYDFSPALLFMHAPSALHDPLPIFPVFPMHAPAPLQEPLPIVPLLLAQAFLRMEKEL